MSKRRIQADEFFTEYLKAHAEGLTREQFAARIGLKAQTIYQRVYETNKALAEAGSKQYPLLRSVSRATVISKAAAILEANGRLHSEPAVAVEEPAFDPLADILG